MKYGYAKGSPGSTIDSVEAQAWQLTKAGCNKVLRDIQTSAAKTDRAQPRRVIDTRGPGDVPTVTRIDRLARSTRDLLVAPAVMIESKTPLRSLVDVQAARRQRKGGSC